jgi:single-strand DNA-binding protein
MNINRVTLVGFAGKDAKTSATQNGKTMTRLSLATSKRWKDAAGEWQEKTQWHDCVAYGPTGDYAAKVLKSAHVIVEGELVHRQYERAIETDNGPVKVRWPVTEVVVESVSVLDRKDKQERRAAS